MFGYYSSGAALLPEGDSCVETNTYERFLKERDLAWCYYRMGKKKQAEKQAEEVLAYLQTSSGWGTLEDYTWYTAYRPAQTRVSGAALCLSWSDGQRAYLF